MSAPIIVVGHKNPDNNSISSAVGYAYLKNELARRAAGEGEPFQDVRSRPLGAVASGERLGSGRERYPRARDRGSCACARRRRDDAQPHIHRP